MLSEPRISRYNFFVNAGNVRKTALVIHQEPGALDAITRALEAFDFDVLSALSAFRAQGYLEGDRAVHVIIAQWDDQQNIGADVYKWSLARRYDLRSQFVFVGDDEPAEFSRLVAGRCLHVTPDRLDELVQMAEAAVMRLVRMSEEPVSEIGINVEAPTILLADDDPDLLHAMTRSLKDFGYQVSAVDSGNSAIAQLTTQDFDIILADWHMGDGNGEALFRWVSEKRPDLIERLVFLSNEGVEEVRKRAPSRPAFPKGQDSADLLKTLEDIVRSVRDEEWR